MEIKEENILFLLGAGCSYDAGIPISSGMVRRVENFIQELTSEWHQYQDLYYYLKSSILYSEGIFGNFNESFNIEKLLIVISEIEKRDRNIVYPFIGTWHTRLLDLAGEKFQNLTALKQLIVNQLNEWISLDNYSNASYYNGFAKFQTTIGKPIRVFTLNYDLCFENIVGKKSKITDGFDKNSLEWHYSNFSNIHEQFCLYKLHGSIDWYLKDSKLFKSERPHPKPELIFGVEAKLRSRDPYLFYIYQFRRFMFEPECKLLIAIGYSFSDDHINEIIIQSLRQRKDRNVLVVSPGKKKEDEKREEIGNKLKLKGEEKNQLKFLPLEAKVFLDSELTIDKISKFMEYDSEDNPF